MRLSVGRVVQAGLLAASASVVAFGCPDARAESAAVPPAATGSDYFLRPVIDGDPARAPGFRPPKPRTGAVDPKPKLRAAAPRNGLPEPVSGTGTTGFNSTNVPGRKAKPLAANAAAPRIASVKTRKPTAAPPMATRTPGPSGPPGPPSANRPGGVANPYARTATEPVPGLAGPRRRPAAEDDPFTPTGVHVGAFLLKPAVELTGGYNTNPAHTSTPRGSTTYLLSPELTLHSLWSRHELNAALRGSYTGYGTLSTFNRPYFDAKVDGRIDVTRDTRIDLAARTMVTTDSPGSPDLPTSLKSLPVNTSYGATFGVGQRFNRFDVTAKATYDRATFGDGVLNNGAIVRNDDRNYDQIGGTLRGSYELTPGVKPFVELGTDRRIHDLTVSHSGVERDSTGRTWRIGSTFELTRKLTGEISAGYLTRDYQDPSLSQLHGVIADASLIWSASALTTVRLTAQSTADETTLTGASGVLKRTAGLEIEHAFRRWLIGTVKMNYGTDDYQNYDRLDRRTDLSAALTYKLSRTMQIKGEFRHEWLRSNVDGQDYTATAFLVGLRLQR